MQRSTYSSTLHTERAVHGAIHSPVSTSDADSIYLHVLCALWADEARVKVMIHKRGGGSGHCLVLDAPDRPALREFCMKSFAFVFVRPAAPGSCRTRNALTLCIPTRVRPVAHLNALCVLPFTQHCSSALQIGNARRIPNQDLVVDHGQTGKKRGTETD